MSRRATILLQALRARQIALIPTPPICRPTHCACAPDFLRRNLHYARPGPSTPAAQSAPADFRTLRDYDIPYPFVRLIDPTTNSLGPQTPLEQILRSYDHATHSLKVVSTDAPAPIVKLFNREEENFRLRAEEARQKLRRKIAFEEKEVQVSWGSATGDVKHKANLAKSFLEKGDRVMLVFASRSPKEKIEKARKEEIVAILEEALSEVGEKVRVDDVQPSGARSCYWGPKAEVAEAVKDKVMEREMNKRKEKEEKKEMRRRKSEEHRQRAAAKAGLQLPDEV